MDSIGAPREGKIWKAIPAIMHDVGAIGKDRKNTAQGYQFRGVDDVYAAVQLVLAKHGVFTVPEVIDDRTEDRTTAKGTALIYRVLKIRFWFFADDGSYFTAVVMGEGMDSGDKASNKAMSVAHKYAFLQVFAVPTVEPKDPENDSHEVEPRRAAIYKGSIDQKRTLEGLFKSNKIPQEKWRAISDRLMDRPMDEFRIVLAEVEGMQ